jgi:oligopeptide/dipeptide ABC transporter ATP-binding protein
MVRRDPAMPRDGRTYGLPSPRAFSGSDPSRADADRARSAPAILVPTEPTRPKCRRQRRDQPKRQRSGGQACDDSERTIVELFGIVDHLVGGGQQRHEIRTAAMGNSLDGPNSPLMSPARGISCSPLNPPGGCVFHPRCWMATAECQQVMPELQEVQTGHWAACIHAPGYGSTQSVQR